MRKLFLVFLQLVSIVSAASFAVGNVLRIQEPTR